MSKARTSQDAERFRVSERTYFPGSVDGRTSQTRKNLSEQSKWHKWTYLNKDCTAEKSVRLGLGGRMSIDAIAHTSNARKKNEKRSSKVARDMSRVIIDLFVLRPSVQPLLSCSLSSHFRGQLPGAAAPCLASASATTSRTSWTQAAPRRFPAIKSRRTRLTGGGHRGRSRGRATSSRTLHSRTRPPLRRTRTRTPRRSFPW